jgi:hypothetical protein
MGYRFRILGSVSNANWNSLPKRVRHMLIVARSPWGPFPTSSLLEWLSLTGFGRGSNRELYLNIPVLHEIEMLSEKVEKCWLNALRVYNSSEVTLTKESPAAKVPSLDPSMPPHMKELLSAMATWASKQVVPRVAWASPVVDPQIDSELAIAKAKEVFDKDPRTCALIYRNIHSEAWSENRKKWLEILGLLKDLKAKVSKDAFCTHSGTIELYWKELCVLEEKFNFTRKHVFNNSPHNPFIRSSSISIVKRFNRFLDESM